jgi:hypothetical protein
MIKYTNMLLFAGMIVMNYIANALPLNNKTTGQLADSYPNLFVPAGITFAIWGIIYLLLAGFCTVQFLGSYQGLLSRIGWLFAWSCLLNGLWIVFWHYEKLPLTLLVMILLLGVLTLLNIRIQSLSLGLVKAAFGIYLGWICIATIANVTALLVHYNWNGFGISEEIWAIIMIVLGACIASWVLFRLQNPFIGLSAIWAFTGIILKRQDDFTTIVVASSVAIAVVAGFTVWGFFQKTLYSLT